MAEGGDGRTREEILRDSAELKRQFEDFNFSLGVAYRRSGETLDEALARADWTLYATRGHRLRKPRARKGEKAK